MRVSIRGIFPPPRLRGGAGWRLPACLFLIGALLAPPAAARVFLTREEALTLAFPDCRVERQTVYLTEAQQQRARELSGGKAPGGLVHRYRATRDGKPAGTAYFDAHRVRTLPEILMVVVDPDGRVRRIEVLAFKEPLDYLPRKAWYDQFAKKALDKRLALGRDIRGITGATLTARATTEAARRILALHRVIEEAAAGAEP